MTEYSQTEIIRASILGLTFPDFSFGPDFLVIVIESFSLTSDT